MGPRVFFCITKVMARCKASAYVHRIWDSMILYNRFGFREHRDEGIKVLKDLHIIDYEQ